MGMKEDETDEVLKIFDALVFHAQDTCITDTIENEMTGDVFTFEQVAEARTEIQNLIDGFEPWRR